MGRSILGLATLAIGCATAAPRPSEPPAQRPGELAAKVELPDRIRAHYRGALSSHAIDFDLPADVEMALSSDGYAWSSAEEHAALAIFAGIYPHDSLVPADDPPLAVARMVLASVGGDVDLLHDRHRLDAPTEATGTGWRVSGGEVGGWLAIFTRESTAKSGERFHYVVFVLAMGPTGSRWAHDGAAVTTIRDSIRFSPR